MPSHASNTAKNKKQHTALSKSISNNNPNHNPFYNKYFYSHHPNFEAFQQYCAFFFLHTPQIFIKTKILFYLCVTLQEATCGIYLLNDYELGNGNIQNIILSAWQNVIAAATSFLMWEKSVLFYFQKNKKTRKNDQEKNNAIVSSFSDDSEEEESENENNNNKDSLLLLLSLYLRYHDREWVAYKSVEQARQTILLLLLKKYLSISVEKGNTIDIVLEKNVKMEIGKFQQKKEEKMNSNNIEWIKEILKEMEKTFWAKKEEHTSKTKRRKYEKNMSDLKKKRGRPEGFPLPTTTHRGMLPSIFTNSHNPNNSLFVKNCARPVKNLSFSRSSRFEDLSSEEDENNNTTNRNQNDSNIHKKKKSLKKKFATKKKESFLFSLEEMTPIPLLFFISSVNNNNKNKNNNTESVFNLLSKSILFIEQFPEDSYPNNKNNNNTPKNSFFFKNFEDANITYDEAKNSYYQIIIAMKAAQTCLHTTPCFGNRSFFFVQCNNNKKKSEESGFSLSPTKKNSNNSFNNNNENLIGFFHHRKSQHSHHISDLLDRHNQNNNNNFNKSESFFYESPLYDDKKDEYRFDNNNNNNNEEELKYIIFQSEVCSEEAYQEPLLLSDHATNNNNNNIQNNNNNHNNIFVPHTPPPEESKECSPRRKIIETPTHENENNNKNSYSAGDLAFANELYCRLQFWCLRGQKRDYLLDENNTNNSRRNSKNSNEHSFDLESSSDDSSNHENTENEKNSELSENNNNKNRNNNNNYFSTVPHTRTHYTLPLQLLSLHVGEIKISAPENNNNHHDFFFNVKGQYLLFQALSMSTTIVIGSIRECRANRGNNNNHHHHPENAHFHNILHKNKNNKDNGFEYKRVHTFSDEEEESDLEDNFHQNNTKNINFCGLYRFDNYKNINTTAKIRWNLLENDINSDNNNNNRKPLSSTEEHQLYIEKIKTLFRLGRSAKLECLLMDEEKQSPVARLTLMKQENNNNNNNENNNKNEYFQIVSFSTYVAPLWNALQRENIALVDLDRTIVDNNIIAMNPINFQNNSENNNNNVCRVYECNLPPYLQPPSPNSNYYYNYEAVQQVQYPFSHNNNKNDNIIPIPDYTKPACTETVFIRPFIRSFLHTHITSWGIPLVLVTKSRYWRAACILEQLLDPGHFLFFNTNGMKDRLPMHLVSEEILTAIQNDENINNNNNVLKNALDIIQFYDSQVCHHHHNNNNTYPYSLLRSVSILDDSPQVWAEADWSSCTAIAPYTLSRRDPTCYFYNNNNNNNSFMGVHVVAQFFSRRSLRCPFCIQSDNNNKNNNNAIKSDLFSEWHCVCSCNRDKENTTTNNNNNLCGFPCFTNDENNNNNNPIFFSNEDRFMSTFLKKYYRLHCAPPRITYYNDYHHNNNENENSTTMCPPTPNFFTLNPNNNNNNNKEEEVITGGEAEELDTSINQNYYNYNSDEDNSNSLQGWRGEAEEVTPLPPTTTTDNNNVQYDNETLNNNINESPIEDVNPL